MRAVFIEQFISSNLCRGAASRTPRRTPFESVAGAVRALASTDRLAVRHRARVTSIGAVGGLSGRTNSIRIIGSASTLPSPIVKCTCGSFGLTGSHVALLQAARIVSISADGSAATELNRAQFRIDRT